MRDTARCAKHAGNYDRARGNAAERGYDGRWQKARDAYIADHPLCVECKRLGLTVPATVVDHIIPHRGDDLLFWDERNWQGLCPSMHAVKTRLEAKLNTFEWGKLRRNFLTTDVAQRWYESLR